MMMMMLSLPHTHTRTSSVHGNLLLATIKSPTRTSQGVLEALPSRHRLVPSLFSHSEPTTQLLWFLWNSTCRAPGGLFLAAGFGDQVGLCPQPLACWMPCGEGGLGLPVGSMGLAGSSPAHAAGPQNVAGCRGTLPAFPVLHGQHLLSHPTSQLRTEMWVFGGIWD